MYIVALVLTVCVWVCFIMCKTYRDTIIDTYKEERSKYYTAL